ncbi:Arc family DNA-binding protein [Rhizobium puerariae]|uniref:Arc family DNA-binding protein n=1 Tax=Rhizobium puerariae TaxID=1585791 RepID=A0ABV6AP96_9HYPH
MAKQDDYARYTIRVPQETYSLIEKAAAEANRSVNAEIVSRLETSLTDMGQEISELSKKLQRRDEQLSIALMEQRKGRRQRNTLVIELENCRKLLDGGAVKRIAELEAQLMARSEHVDQLYEQANTVAGLHQSIAQLREDIELIKAAVLRKE